MLHSLAEGDVVSGWERYEQQQPGLGDRFVAAVGEAIASACRWPNTGTPTIHDDHGTVVERKVATSEFPYAVRYRATAQELIVMAVYHQHRHPDFETNFPELIPNVSPPSSSNVSGNRCHRGRHLLR